MQQTITLVAEQPAESKLKHLAGHRRECGGRASFGYGVPHCQKGFTGAPSCMRESCLSEGAFFYLLVSAILRRCGAPARRLQPAPLRLLIASIYACRHSVCETSSPPLAPLSEAASSSESSRSLDERSKEPCESECPARLMHLGHLMVAARLLDPDALRWASITTCCICNWQQKQDQGNGQRQSK